VKVVGSRPACGFESRKIENNHFLENAGGHCHRLLLPRCHFGWVSIWEIVFYIYIDGIILLPKILEIFLSNIH
jgi:hypothetical protein